MIFNSFWWLSALLGTAGGFLLFGPARSRLRHWPRSAAVLVLVSACIDLSLGPILFSDTPLSAWASVLLIFSMIGRQKRPEPKSAARSIVGEEDWMLGLSASNDAIAILDAEHQKRSANPAWEALFPHLDPGTDPALSSLLERAAHEKHAVGLLPRRPPSESPRLDQSDSAAQIEASVTLLGNPNDVERRRWLVIVPSRQATDLAHLARRLGHNFNNLLSAIVGGAGMAMDLVEADSEAHRELVEIEDVAMRAADLTSELQQAAREVAPPSIQPPPQAS